MCAFLTGLLSKLPPGALAPFWAIQLSVPMSLIRGKGFILRKQVRAHGTHSKDLEISFLAYDPASSSWKIVSTYFMTSCNEFCYLGCVLVSHMPHALWVYTSCTTLFSWRSTYGWQSFPHKNKEETTTTTKPFKLSSLNCHAWLSRLR